MQGKMSKNLCEAWVKRRIRNTSQLPIRFAYLRLDKVTGLLKAMESVFEASTTGTIHMRQSGIERQKVTLSSGERLKAKTSPFAL